MWNWIRREPKQKVPVRVPKWACALAVFLGAAGLIIQAAVDVYQSVNPAMDWQTWGMQAWQASLPTGFALAFAAFAGALFFAGRWVVAFGLYAIVGGFMAITGTNSMDFVTNHTVLKTRAHLTRQADVKAIAEKQNDTALKERKEATDNLWRTYNTAKSGAEKDRVLLKIEEITSKPLALQQTEVEVVAVGSGGILSKYLGWSPESVQEARAVAFPLLVMVGKVLAITLGVGFWPPSTAAAERWRSQHPKVGKFPPGLETERKFTKAEAREDIIKAGKAGAYIGSNQELSDRWHVTESCTSKWLADFRKEGLIKRERHGKFMAVRVTAPDLAGEFPIALNGNGRAHA